MVPNGLSNGLRLHSLSNAYRVFAVHPALYNSCRKSDGRVSGLLVFVYGCRWMLHSNAGPF